MRPVRSLRITMHSMVGKAQVWKMSRAIASARLTLMCRYLTDQLFCCLISMRAVSSGMLQPQRFLLQFGGVPGAPGRDALGGDLGATTAFHHVTPVLPEVRFGKPCAATGGELLARWVAVEHGPDEVQEVQRKASGTWARARHSS